MNPVCLALNTPAYIFAASGYDQYGQAVYATRRPIKCAVIKLGDILLPSPIRSEASASHGRADEDTGIGAILIPASVTVNANDRIDVFNTSYSVTGVSDQYDTWGKINHHQVAIKRLVVPNAIAQGSM